MSDWRDVLVTTVDLKNDYEIIDLISIVSADNTWKQQAKELGLDIATGWLESGTVDNLFAVASALLKHQADQMGATAVVGTEFDITKDQHGFAIIAFGTAVKY